MTHRQTHTREHDIQTDSYKGHMTYRLLQSQADVKLITWLQGYRGEPLPLYPDMEARGKVNIVIFSGES